MGAFTRTNSDRPNSGRTAAGLLRVDTDQIAPNEGRLRFSATGVRHPSVRAPLSSLISIAE